MGALSVYHAFREVQAVHRTVLQAAEGLTTAMKMPPGAAQDDLARIVLEGVNTSKATNHWANPAATQAFEAVEQLAGAAGKVEDLGGRVSSNVLVKIVEAKEALKGVRLLESADKVVAWPGKGVAPAARSLGDARGSAIDTLKQLDEIMPEFSAAAHTNRSAILDRVLHPNEYELFAGIVGGVTLAAVGGYAVMSANSQKR